jgi:hypothetical protein
VKREKAAVWALSSTLAHRQNRLKLSYIVKKCKLRRIAHYQQQFVAHYQLSTQKKPLSGLISECKVRIAVAIVPLFGFLAL